MKSARRSRASESYGLDSSRPAGGVRFDRNAYGPVFTVSHLEKYQTTREKMRASVRSSGGYKTQWQTFLRFTSKEEETMRVVKERQHSAYNDKHLEDSSDNETNFVGKKHTVRHSLQVKARDEITRQAGIETNQSQADISSFLVGS